MATTIQTIEVPKKARALDNSGNNNHGQIYSGRGLEFDGVSDHLLTGYGNGLNPYTTPITVAIWAKTATTGGKIFIGPTAGTNQRFYIGFNNGVWDMGIQNSQWSTTTNEVSGFSDQPSYEVDTWYRIVIVMSAGQATMYVNGVKSYAKTYTSYVFNSDITIGNFDPNANFYWNGMLSDAQIWDAALTQADITYDYLNPESLALNAGGTALTESNLKLWYPMQDGHRGQQSYILDGANTGLGVELVENNDFSSTENWGVTGGWEVLGDGKATNDGSNSSILRQTDTVPLNTKFKVVFTVADYVSGNIQIKFAPTAQTITITGDGTYTTYSDGTNSANEDLQVIATSNFEGSITNISVKQINDKNHATTVFYGDEQISATNDRTFAGASNWANAAGANAFNAYDETTSGQLTVTPDDVGDVQYAFLDGAHWEDADGAGPAMVEGRTYRLSYDIHVSAFTKGTLSVGLSTDAVPAVMTFKNDYTATNGSGASATLDFVYTAATCEMITVYAAANTVLTADFDNFSLKEVGTATGWTDADQQLHIPQTALQSYNELAWFDGTVASNGYVDLDSGITTSGNSWSLSFWVFHDDNGQAFDIIFGDGANQFIALSKDSVDKLMYRDSSNTYHAISDAAIPESEWVHIAITAIADTSMTAYINGVAQTTNIDMTNTTLLLERFMRGYSSVLYHTFGTINEISYYNDVLTSAEVLDLFNDGKAKSALEADGSAGLVGYWRNNGLSEWKDLKGSNDGNTTAGVTETILIPQGVDSTRDNQGFIMNKQKDTSCLNLTNGSDDPIVDLGSTTTVAADGTASFVMWVKPDDVSDNFITGLASTDSLRIHNATTIKYRAASGTHHAFAFGSGDIAVGKWSHLALVKAGGGTDEISVYIDGVLNGTASTDTETSNEEFDYRYIGGLPTDTFRGQLDGFLVYSDVLTTAEVLRNYNATKGNHRN